eukprot:CAMPEP_0181199824 /NCGR_PEP_ID=MMETSP1096-20121128/17398_1 /TAXON_ID=156174 ORGANISM="Chrysochromulina ericina, Strain CCMP281" /NCGR_SAMPLE_ID=MMETSP1096 /ASSEMBLY_ACC=CAM_ASM_000453 /LENGTH=40 /DNA_ID= /DNA_START= /DNA_END= /DNA_ORIENTATION=
MTRCRSAVSGQRSAVWQATTYPDARIGNVDNATHSLTHPV